MDYWISCKNFVLFHHLEESLTCTRPTALVLGRENSNPHIFYLIEKIWICHRHPGNRSRRMYSVLPNYDVVERSPSQWMTVQIPQKRPDSAYSSETIVFRRHMMVINSTF